MAHLPTKKSSYRLKVYNGFNDYGLVDMGKREILLFLWFCLQVREETDKYDIKYSDIIKTELFGRISVKQMKDTLVNVSKKLIHAAGSFKNREGKLVVGTFFTFILPTEEKDSDYFTLKIDSDLKEMLLHLTETYTILDIVQMNELKSPYALKLYRKLKQYQNTGTYKASLDDFKTMMGISETVRNYDITSRFINPAIDELRRIFPELSYTKSVDGQFSQITGFTFSWKPTPKRVRTEEEREKISEKTSGYWDSVDYEDDTTVPDEALVNDYSDRFSPDEECPFW